MNQQSEKLAYGVKEAARAIGVSERTLWRRIGEGKIAAREAGMRTIILAKDLRDYIEGLPMKVAQS